MTTTITAIQEAGLRDQVKIIVGGAPVTQDYADQIGTDGYSPDAGRAVSLAGTDYPAVSSPKFMTNDT